MPSRNTIVVGVVVLLILIGGGFMYLHSRSQVISNVSNGGVAYEMKEIVAGEGEVNITYPQIVSGLPKLVIDSINSKIQKEIVGNSCFGDPVDPNAVTDLRSVYLDELAANNGTPIITEGTKSGVASDVEVSRWSYATVRQHLVTDFLFYSIASTTVAYNANGLLSLSVYYDLNCGGAHPNTGYFGMTFTLTDGTLIPFSDIFTHYERDKKAIEKLVYTYANTVSSSEDNSGECDYLAGWQEGGLSADDISYALSPHGLVMLDFGYPHALAPCNPDGSVVVPFSLLKPYLKQTGSIAKLMQ